MRRSGSDLESGTSSKGPEPRTRSLQSGQARPSGSRVSGGQPDPTMLGSRLVNQATAPVYQATTSQPTNNSSTDTFFTPAAAASSDVAGLGKWQVEMETGNWVDFDAALQKAFSTALTHGLESVPFTVSHQRYDLVFADSVQRNSRTGKERRVRCVSADAAADAARASLLAPSPPARQPAGGPGTRAPAATTSATAAFSSSMTEWQVQMDSGKWIDFDAVSNAIVNDALGRADAAAYFRSYNQDYELSFAAGTQKNVKTGKERPVRTKRAGFGDSAPPMPLGDDNPPDTTVHIM